MKIAMVSEHSDPAAAVGDVDAGGQNVYVAALAKGLALRSHEITVYTRRLDPGAPFREMLYPGVIIERVSAGPERKISKNDIFPFVREFGDHLRSRWQAQPPDIVHCHYWMSALAALQAAEPAVPIVHTYHSLGSVKRRHLNDGDTSPDERIECEMRIGRRARCIVATCPSEVSELVAMGIERSRISVIPCGVDLDLFTPDGAVFPRRSSQRIVAVGRLVEHKGFDNLIHAVAQIPNVELLVAGGPPLTALQADAEAQRLQGIATWLGIADRIRLLGQVARGDMPALLRSADLVACTPWYEPFGMVPLEAMACNVPVLVTVVGGLADTVRHGVTGVCVPPRDVTSLEKALRCLLLNPLKRGKLASAGLRHVRADYGWSVVTDRVLKVYESLTAGT